MMNKPNFSEIISHARTKRIHQAVGVRQEVAKGETIFRCECCNDTGIVQSWKIERFIVGERDDRLDPVMSIPIFCGRLPECGNVTMQVYSGIRDDKEDNQRTETLSLYSTPGKENTYIAAGIASGRFRALTLEQSTYIHNAVIEYRNKLWTDEGQDYVAEVRKNGREAQASKKPTDRLSHISCMMPAFNMPKEPF